MRSSISLAQCADARLPVVSRAIQALEVVISILQPVFFVAAAVLGVVAAGDWAVRTRRISPFSRTARFFRSAVDPLIAPIERRIVRSGGLPSSAPWYALAAVVIGGIVVITLLQFAQGQLARASFAAGMGSRGILSLLVGWIFGIVKIALLVYVISGWIRVSPYSPWVRWAYAISEPLLRPLRRIIPIIGGAIDITPLVLYFLISFLVEPMILRAL